jgi:hypothetical protein
MNESEDTINLRVVNLMESAWVRSDGRELNRNVVLSNLKMLPEIVQISPKGVVTKASIPVSYKSYEELNLKQKLKVTKFWRAAKANDELRGTRILQETLERASQAMDAAEVSIRKVIYLSTS